MEWIIILMHRFKLAQIKTPGSVGLSISSPQSFTDAVLEKNILIEFSRSRNGNVTVIGKKYPYDM